MEDWPPHLSGADERGWFRFQRLYDIARSVLRTRRTCTGCCWRWPRTSGPRARAGWRSRSTRPGTRAVRRADPHAGAGAGLRRAATATGVGIGVIIAANRTKHPLEARTLARLAACTPGAG